MSNSVLILVIVIGWLIVDVPRPLVRDPVVEGQRRGLEAVTVAIAVVPVLSTADLDISINNRRWQPCTDVLELKLVSGDRITFRAGSQSHIVRVVGRSGIGYPGLGSELVVHKGKQLTVVVTRGKTLGVVSRW